MVNVAMQDVSTIALQDNSIGSGSINEEYYQVLELAVEFAGIFRANPHYFVKYYLNIELKDFQKVILWEMFNNNYGMYIASRGQGIFLPCINREKSVKPKIFNKLYN